MKIYLSRLILAESFLTQVIHSRAGMIQRGSSLIIGLIFLGIMTTMAVSLTNSSRITERMASNMRNSQVAMQAAEATIRYVESNNFKNPPLEPFNATVFETNCIDGFCGPLAPDAHPYWQTVNWDSGNETRISDAPLLAGLSTQPRYIIEFVANEGGGQSSRRCPFLVFRITARGVAQNGAEVFTQSIYRHQPRRFFDDTCT